MELVLSWEEYGWSWVEGFEASRYHSCCQMDFFTSWKVKNRVRSLLETILNSLFSSKPKIGSFSPLLTQSVASFLSPHLGPLCLSIWKFWEFIWHLIANNGILDQYNTIYGEKSIWWNLMHKDKSLALIQGCSARNWAYGGIINFNDIINNGALIPWCDLMHNFQIPSSN